MRPLAILLTLTLAASACDGRTNPIAPSLPLPPGSQPPAIPPGTPGPTRVTFTVRSGAEGLPVVPGASIHTAGAAPRTTDSQGTASLDDVAMPAVYTVDAPGFVSYRGRAASPNEVVTLWPWQPGMTDWWILMTSYYGPDYNKVLWRPDRDVRLELQGVLELEPYRSVWENAVREVAAAIDSGGSGGPTVRLTSGAGAVPVRLNERPTCEVARWSLTPPILTPPPFVSVSTERGARDPETVLDMVAQLTGFSVALSRREGPPHTGGTLSAIERTAIRMRMLRPPGTYFNGQSLEDTTVSEAEGTSGYWCR
jgi:hypothetical protein